MAENKKIKNARKTVFNDITFKSKLEEGFYITLQQAGFNVKYEEMKFTLIEGFIPTVPFYNRNKAKVFKEDNRKIKAITYTPDFTITYNDTLIIIEAKGLENDVFPIKRKLFRRYLETMKEPCMYFEVHTKRELLQVIEIIKNETIESNKVTIKGTSS